MSKGKVRSSDSDDEWVQDPPLALRDNWRGKLWDTTVSDSHIDQYGAMHFPIDVGKLIPEELKRIDVKETSTHRSYNIRMSYAKRNHNEKHLVGKKWREFLNEHNVQVGDKIEWELDSEAIKLNATLFDENGNKLKAPAEKLRKKHGNKEGKNVGDMGSICGVKVKEEIM